MKYPLLVFFLITCQTAFTQEIYGKWKTIDDETGEAKSVVEIYKSGDLVQGKIVKLYPNPEEDPDPICDLCPEDDPRFKKKIVGMEIIKGLKQDGNEFVGGTVLKPDEGKIYKCKIWLEGEKLHIRGYWGFFYRTQVWERYD